MAASAKVRPTALDRIIMHFAPERGTRRLIARAKAELFARHYEAASIGRRTANWPRSGADANVAAGASLATLRALSRDLRRNNPWARRGVQVIANNTVGWGIVPSVDDTRVMDAWKKWAESTECDADGRLNFYGLQRHIMETIAESGEVLVRARPRRPSDGYTLPLQLQVLEPDFIDITKDAMTGSSGGPIVQGVEFDAIGRRVAYWLYPEHPGSNRASMTSKPIPASSVAHIFRSERPGQVRGVPWLSAVIQRLREFDEYEDATIMRHKVAALFAVFKIDPAGDPADMAIGEQGTDARGLEIETIEPGAIVDLGGGRDVKFANPPVPADGGFTDRSLRAVASGLGVTFEDLTGNYGNVNYSSGRLGWMAHWANVEDWRWNMLVPQFCAPAWDWAMQAAQLAGLLGSDPSSAPPRATWTPPARPMLDPDKEGLAYKRRVRSGAMTPSEMVREQGKDPKAHWQEYANDLAELDRLGIVLDCDPRRVSDAGLTQVRAGAGGGGGSGGDTGAGAAAGDGSSDGTADAEAAT